jgi:serine phosphatase RsbU (regulator of sigma subunit)
MAPIAVGADFARPLDVSEDLGGLPLGVLTDAEYQSVRVPWPEAARGLLFYTDGLTEAERSNGDLLGLSPLTDALAKLPEITSASMIRSARMVVRDTLQGRPRNDDMTLLAVTREP